ncbi:polysaccharide deacetylase family protein [Patescibacteria group bacterium]|nr:polysaccharide deacetylase family protein [Patescibacteria group bacterium]
MFTFTTSWDDGDKNDLRIADLLDRYGMRGTFYIAKSQKNRLSEEDILALSKQQEIGAHTLTHADLPLLTKEEKIHEIQGSKEWLESVTGNSVHFFCYPYGRVDEETREVVATLGFKAARSSVKTLGTKPTDPYMLPVTTMTYRAPYTPITKMLLIAGVTPASNSGWEVLVREKLEKVAADEGYFHLWGHSWEIEKLKLWSSLEMFLKEVSLRKDVLYVSNGELADKVFYGE